MLPQGEGDAPDPLIGQLLVQKFRIDKLIGQGAMGRVYSATQEPINRRVAVKILHQHLMEDRRVARRFQREAEAASRFSHPNSIGIFDFGQTAEGSLYIAMEYIDGRDLAEIISQEAPISPERCVRIATQVLNALHLAHSSRIIHRDLKPENIMLTDLPGHKDFVKVCDFGIAKIQQQPGKDQESALTMFGMICGTPYYMSPEQAKGEELDGRTDLYSMGVILYEMLTGRVPFRGSTPVEVIARHLTDPPTPPSKVDPNIHVPRALEQIILRAMSKTREERFEDATAFSGALEKALKETEFQADLERVLQESQENAQNHTPSKPLDASSPTARVTAGGIPQHVMASASAPPVARPRSTSSELASQVSRTASSAFEEPVSTDPLTPLQGNVSRHTPVPSVSMSPVEHEPLLLSDEFEDVPPKSKKTLAIVVLLIGVAALVGGYVYLEQNKPKTNTVVHVPAIRGYAPSLRGAPSKRRTLTSKKLKKQRTKRSTNRGRKRAYRKKSTRRYNSSYAFKKKFQKQYQRLAYWKKVHQIYAVDFNAYGRRIERQCLAYVNKGQYNKAYNSLNKLIHHLNGLRGIPSWAANNKFKRFQKQWDKISSQTNPSDKAKVEGLLFPMMNAQGTKQYNKLNKMMNRAFSILRKY